MIGPAAVQASEVIVRNPGGAYDGTMRRIVYEPFTRATGVRVTAISGTAARLMAMLRSGNAPLWQCSALAMLCSGNVELEVFDGGDSILEQLRRQNALADLDYGSWRFTKPEDVDTAMKFSVRVGNLLHVSVMGYGKEVFPNGHPQNWAQFWDTQRFPGPHTLANMATGAPNLEFALLPCMVLRIYSAMKAVEPGLFQAAEGMGACPLRVFFRVFLPLTLHGVAAGVALVILRSALTSVEPNLERAAMICGCDRWGVFRRVVMPLALPAVISAALFSLLTCFDELMVSLSLAGVRAEMLPVRIWHSLLLEVEPTIAAISSVLIGVTVEALLLDWLVRRMRSFPAC